MTLIMTTAVACFFSFLVEVKILLLHKQVELYHLWWLECGKYTKLIIGFQEIHK
jgi:hypothetical protein